MSETWKEDKFVKNWFELLGNKRTIQNYSEEFPKFLKYIQAQTPYKTPSQNHPKQTRTLDHARFAEETLLGKSNSKIQELS